MSKSRLHVFGWGLVAAAFLVLCSTSFGVGEARAGNCVANNLIFNLVSLNSCCAPTQLDSTGTTIGLDVFDATPNAFTLEGEATAATGAGIGVYGYTNSSGTNARGVAGGLQNSTPGMNSAGVL